MRGLSKVPLFDDEHLNSFAARTARANGRSSLRGFLNDFGIGSDRFVRGDEKEVREFASMVSMLPDVLLRRRFHVQADKSVEFSGHWLSKHMVVRGRLRFCARCLTDDANDDRRMLGTRQYGRAFWMVSAVRTCPVHDRPLSEAPEAGFRHLAFDFCSLAEAHSDVVVEEGRWDLSRKATDFEVFVTERLRGDRRDGALLDGLTLATAIDICELVGLASRRGREFRSSQVDDEEKRLASDAGFQVLRAGPTEFDRFLDGLSECGSKSNSRGGKAMYGRLYSLLERRGDGHEAFKAAVRSHALTRHVMLPTASVFGEVGKKSWTTIHAIALAVDLPDALVRRHLIHLGLIDAASPSKGEAFIAANVAEQAIALLKNSVRRKGASELLGCSPAEFARLEKHGLVKAIGGDNDTGAVRDRYSERDIVGLRERMIAMASGDPVGMITLTSACRQTRIPQAKVIALLLEGSIKASFVPQASLFDSIKVDMDGLRATLKAKDHLNAREVCEHLRLHRNGLASVIRAGLLKVVDADADQVNSPILVARAEVDAFDGAYATIMKLVAETGRGPTILNDTLRELGVEQLLNRASHSVVLYDRAQVASRLRLGT